MEGPIANKERGCHCCFKQFTTSISNKRPVCLGCLESPDKMLFYEVSAGEDYPPTIFHTVPLVNDEVRPLLIGKKQEVRIRPVEMTPKEYSLLK